MARYLRPEVTNEGNHNIYSATDDTVLRSTTKQVDRQVKEIAEKEQGEKNYNQNEKNAEAVKCLLPEARVVNKDNNAFNFETTIKQSFHAAMWCPDTDHKQEGEIIIPDVQENIENEQKQTKSEAHMEQEAPTSDASLAEYASNKNRWIKTEQKLKETKDIEQKDGHNKDTKIECDHYNEDDSKTRVMKIEDLDGTEVTVQSVLYGKDPQQKEMVNKMDYIETEDTMTEYVKEKMDKCVTNQKIVCKNQERAENDEDKESELLENDVDLLAKLVCSTEDETDLLKPFEIENLRVKETYLENVTNEGIQTPERQEEIISKNVVEMPESIGKNEQDKHIEGHEQHKWLDNYELADILSKKEACEKRLETVEILPRLSKQTFEENVTFSELGPKTTTVVNEGVNKTFDTSEDTMQSNSLEVIRTLNASSNYMLVEAIEIEQDLKTPISPIELGTKQMQTPKEMVKFTLKESVKLKTKLLVETMKREINSEEKAEDFMTANQADNEIYELNIEKKYTTVDTLSESLKERKQNSSVEINGKQLNAEDTPDVTEAKTELIMDLDLQDKSERHTEKLENIEAEVRLLGEAEALTTVESLEEMMNQVLKETIEMENKFIQEQEPSSETCCNVEFQRPTCAILLEDKRELLGETVESLVEMVESGIDEAAKMQKDPHTNNSPECEPTDADIGFKQLEKNTVGETLFSGNDDMSEINRPGLKRRFDDISKDLPRVKDQMSPLVEWSTTVDLNVQVMQNI